MWQKLIFLFLFWSSISAQSFFYSYIDPCQQTVISSSYNISKNHNYNFNPIRNDIIDRNGILLSRNITAYHAAIKPSFIKDKKKFLVKIKLVLPEVDSKKLIDQTKDEVRNLCTQFPVYSR